MMYSRRLKKPDGRDLTLYGRQPVEQPAFVPSPSSEPVEKRGAHRRWHPLRGEWVSYAAHRQHRTFLPPKEFNPLAPTTSREFPTELPPGNYDVAVFDNMFPTLVEDAAEPPRIEGVETAAASGACEVVVFTQDANASLGRLSLDHLALLLEVWGERHRVLGARDDIAYVMAFENRGVEVGVTLHHPHGQIYAYPFVPPVPARENEMQARFFAEHGRGILDNCLSRELADGSRIIYRGALATAFVPAFARYTYEVWVLPNRPVSSLSELNGEELFDLARALKTVLLKYDGLWQKPFPYLMVVHQAPTDGNAHPESHVYIEFSPPYRTRDRLKYLAGTELGAGMFANDTLPEAKARELQAVAVTI